MHREKANIWWGPPKKFTSRIEERKISWLELFYDLVYVIAISKVTHLFVSHPGISGLIDYLYLFIMIFWGWLNGSLYHDLHGSPGIRTRFITLWQMMAVAALIVCLNSPSDVIQFRSTIALMILQLLIIYLWWSVGIYDKHHRVYNRPYTICFLLATLLLFSTLFLDDSLNRIVFWIALILNFLPPFLAISLLKRNNENFSLSNNMVERLGLFTIIVFGECVLGVINSVTQLSELSFQVWINFAFGILIIFALWWIFFSIIADRESRTGFLNANLIEISYIPTLASLGIIGASFPGLLMYLADPDDPQNFSVRLFFGSALFIFLSGITIITFLLKYAVEFNHARKRVRQMLMTTGIIILLVSILFSDMSLWLYFLIIFSLLLIIIVALTRIWFVVQLKLLEREEEKK